MGKIYEQTIDKFESLYVEENRIRSGRSKAVVDQFVSVHIHLPYLGLEGFTPRSANIPRPASPMGLKIQKPMYFMLYLLQKDPLARIEDTR